MYPQPPVGQSPPENLQTMQVPFVSQPAQISLPFAYQVNNSFNSLPYQGSPYQCFSSQNSYNYQPFEVNFLLAISKFVLVVDKDTPIVEMAKVYHRLMICVWYTKNSIGITMLSIIANSFHRSLWVAHYIERCAALYMHLICTAVCICMRLLQ